MALNMFVNTDVPLGVRVEFYFHWSEWIKTIHNNVNTLSDANLQTDKSSQSESFQSIQSDQSIQFTQSLQSNQVRDSIARETMTNENPLNLNMILNSNPYGLSLIKKFNETNVMDENLRKVLCESILQYCIQHNHELSVDDSARLAKQICKVFPGEVMVYLFFSFTLIIIVFQFFLSFILTWPI